MNEIKCGRLGMHTISDCADRAAIVIAESSKPRAVCLSPDGHVTVESPGGVVEEDLVGVYAPRPGRFALWQLISEDLLATKVERNIVGGKNHRHRVKKSQRHAA